MRLINVLDRLLSPTNKIRNHATLFALLLAVVAAALAFGLTPPAYADEAAGAANQTTEAAPVTAEPTPPVAGEVTPEAATPTGETVANDAAESPEDVIIMGNDYLWFGRKTNLNAYEGANDVIGAGETISIADSHVAGSLRLAGRDINISNTIVGEAVTLAGQTVSVDGMANAVALAGQNVTFAGATNELWAAGQKVVIDGTVRGNVHIKAQKIELGSNAHIEGTLSGEVGEQPTIAEGATIADNQLTINAEQQEPADFKSKLDPLAIGFSVLGTILMALLAEWVAGGHTEGAAALLKSGPLGYIGTSIVGAIVVPLIIVLLCVPVVTIPAAIATLLVLSAIGLVSAGFTSAMFGRLIMPRMGRYKAAALMGLLVGLLCSLPYAAAPARCIVFLLMLGYVLRSLRLAMIERREARNEEVVQF